MNPNSAVWGAPESWQPVKWLYNVGGYDPTDKKAGRPKSANFSDGGDTSASLNAGNTAGKTPINTPLDKTICPCGQDAAVSVFGKIALFKNKQNAQQNIIPDKIITRENPCNWAFYDKYSTNDVNFIRDRTNPSSRWCPDADINSNNNGSINPYVFYQSRSLFANIYVRGYTGWNSYNQPMWSRTMSLYEWKNNYSDHFITDIWLVLNGIYSISGDTYSYAHGQAANYRGFGVMMLDDIDGIYDYATSPYPTDQYIRLISDCSANYANTTSTFYMFGYGAFENEDIRGTSFSGDGGWGVHRAIPYSAANYEKIMKMVACFGIPFSDKNISQFTYTSSDLYLPIVDDNGITHGEYTHGTDNANNPFYNLESVRDKDYDPGKQIDPNTYSNVTGFNSLTSGATMTKRYVLDAGNVDKLGTDLWTICGSLSSSDFEYFDGKLKDEFLTTNPIDSIVSLQRFPFEIPHTGSSKAPIKIGKSTVTAEGYQTVNPLNTILFSGKDIFPRFGDCFLDYEPYTTYEVYIPFCGTTKLRAADILGHTLNIQMQIDLFTGSVTAYIMADQLVIETINGSCGVDQTVSGTQTATVNANIYNGILNQQIAKSQYIAHAAGALSPSNWFNPVGYAAKGEQVEAAYKEATYSIEHTEVPPHAIGAASPLLGWVQEFDARILIYYPEGDVIDSSIPPKLNKEALAAFGHIKGFGTVSPGTVSSFHGFTQATVFADNIPCTESERSRIKEAFTSGVYLP